MDGTLVDSHLLVEHVLSMFAEKYCLDFEEVKALAHGMQAIDMTRHYLGDTQEAITVAEYLERYEEEHVEGIVAMPGARALLKALPQERVAMVTSAGRTLASRRMNAAGLDTPAVAVCAEDAQPGKPNPLCYEMGAHRLGVEVSRCLVIEDAVTGIRAGLAAGAVVFNVGPVPELTNERLFNITGLEDITVDDTGESLVLTYSVRDGKT